VGNGFVFGADVYLQRGAEYNPDTVVHELIEGGYRADNLEDLAMAGELGVETIEQAKEELMRSTGDSVSKDANRVKAVLQQEFSESESISEGKMLSLGLLTISFPEKIGNYTVEKLIARTPGYLIVRAKNQQNNDVVLKILRPNSKNFKDYQRWFVREYLFLQKFNQAPGIERLLGWGKFRFQEKEMYFLAKEYLGERNLAQQIDTVALSDQAIVGIGKQIHNFINYMCQQGVLYFDLKPENLFVIDNKVRFSDFGIFYYSSDNPQLNIIGSVDATQLYMPQEMSYGQITQLSSLFALGMILYRLKNRCVFDVSLLEDISIYINNRKKAIKKKYPQDNFNPNEFDLNAYIGHLLLTYDDSSEHSYKFGSILNKEGENLSVGIKALQNPEDKEGGIDLVGLKENIMTKPMLGADRKVISSAVSQQSVISIDQIAGFTFSIVSIRRVKNIEEFLQVARN
jgi:serine/threonine protein kinase